MKSLPTRLAVLVALVLAGCDSNPDAPTATPAATAGPGTIGAAPPAGATPAPTAPPGKGRMGRRGGKAAGLTPTQAD